MAEAFIPNPNNYPIVMHIDNNKKNNNVDNLKWGTISENTKQAFNDGLIKNTKSWEDNQSIPCTCYDTLTNQWVGDYGSIREASRIFNITPKGVLDHINNPTKPIRKKYYFVNYKEAPSKHNIVVEYDWKTNKEVAKYINVTQASKKTGISNNIISCQVKKNKKPKYKHLKTYFLYKEI